MANGKHKETLNEIALAALNDAIEKGAHEEPIERAMGILLLEQRRIIAAFVRDSTLGRDALAAAISRGEDF